MDAKVIGSVGAVLKSRAAMAREMNRGCEGAGCDAEEGEAEGFGEDAALNLGPRLRRAPCGCRSPACAG